MNKNNTDNRLRIAREDLIHTVWIPVRLFTQSYTREIKPWLDENSKGAWTSSWAPGATLSNLRRYDFELEEDAIWFTLRWS